MDFAWVVDALRRGLKVTRKDWLLAIPPMYLYMVTEKKPDGKCIIKMHPGTSHDFEWTPTAEQMLTVDDWEEYVEPKKGPVFGNTKLFLDENGQPYMGNTTTAEEWRRIHSCPLPFVMDASDSHGGKPAEGSDVEEDTGYIAKLAGMLADSCAEKISQRVVQLLQKTDVPLSK